MSCKTSLVGTGGEQPWAPPTAPPPPKRSGRTVKVPGIGVLPLWAVALGVVCLFFLIVAVAADTKDDDDGSEADAAYAAHAVCADFTRDRLKSPSTADFPEYDDAGVSITHASTSTWRVRSFVDSENSFGAILRTHFVCEVRRDGDTWHLITWLEA